LYGEYLLNAQGEDVVAGIRTPNPISQLKKELPEVYDQFASIAGLLEQHYHDMQDCEFTIERGNSGCCRRALVNAVALPPYASL
jgi:pyruvate,orthophosphate dikinase